MKKRQTKQRQNMNELLNRLTSINSEIITSFRMMDEILEDLRKNGKVQ